jgi:hypothetical protein
LFWWFCNLLVSPKGRTRRVFEERVLRRIFGSKKDEITLGCRKYDTEIYLQHIFS